MKPRSMKLTGKCQRCGEVTEFILTEQDIKALSKAIKKATPEQATKYMDHYLERRGFQTA